MTSNTASWQPVKGHIMTRWAADVSPESALPEYPRPQMARPEWLNLNGLWDYAIQPREQQAAPTQPEGQILVPFAIESALSGVKHPLQPHERLWYRRTFSIPAAWQGQRLLLHFGAVDWEATVWVNGQEVGIHRGGHAPFSFEITDQVIVEQEQELVVAVWDPTDSHWQERGKQVLEPKMIWYTAVSGIWQTVWLEPVPQTYIQAIKLTPSVEDGTLTLEARIDGDAEGASISASVLDDPSDGRERDSLASGQAPAGEPIRLTIPEPVLWSPNNPHLYDLDIRLQRNGQILDRVQSYAGLRSFGLKQDAQGTPRLCLNGEPLFFYGPLDQGYWPGELYTAPTDEALRYDLEFCKSLGFNMVRKHIKIEPARWYYHCDRLGLVVWQDMINGGSAVGSILSFLALTVGVPRRDDRRYGRHGREDPASRENYWQELKEMIDCLYNAPCIGQWIPFNEGWGQFDAAAIAEWVKTADPTRPVDHASGWFDQSAGDVKSTHVYFTRLRMPRAGKDRASVISEFGGYGLVATGHEWQPGTTFGYKKFDSSEELTSAYVKLLREQLQPLIDRGLSGAVYTQLTDVEIEVNGYMTYDREVVKMKAGQVRAAHRALQGDHKEEP